MKTKVTKIQVDEMMTMLQKMKDRGVSYVNMNIHNSSSDGDTMEIYPYNVYDDFRNPAPLSWEDADKLVEYG